MSPILTFREHAILRYIERHALDLAPGLAMTGYDAQGQPVYERPPAAAIEEARQRLDAAAPGARRMQVQTTNGLHVWYLPALNCYCVVVESATEGPYAATVLPRGTTLGGVRIEFVTPDELDALFAAGAASVAAPSRYAAGGAGAEAVRAAPPQPVHRAPPPSRRPRRRKMVW